MDHNGTPEANQDTFGDRLDRWRLERHAETSRDTPDTPAVAPEPPKRKRGRPPISDDEKRRRGTFQKSRAREPLPVEPMRLDTDPEAKQDYLAVMVGYMDGVRSGRIVAGKWVKLAVERQYEDMEREGWEFAFSRFFASKACAFIEALPHVEGRWSSALIHLEPWQVFVVCCLFGWRHKSDSFRRRFTVFYLELARKNAKSTLAAGMALYHLLREDEPGAQVICGATTGSQARIVLDIAKKMCDRSAFLRQAGVVTLSNSIRYLDGLMKSINAKASSQDGLNPSVILLDEAHAQDFELHDVLKSAQGARDNSLMLCPTTAGYDLLSVGYAMHQTVRKILQHVVSAEHYFGIIYAIDYEDGDDWQDETVWPKANPMLGVTPKMDKFRQNFVDAQNMPGGERDFLIKQLSVWSGAGTGFLSLAKWDKCADPSCRLERFIGKECCIGGDLSQSDDITAVAYTFKEADLFWSCVQLYLPEDVVEERARKVPEYEVWVRLGILKLTPGGMIDVNLIEKDIRANLQRFKAKDIAFDQWGSLQLVGSLFNDSYPARIETKNSVNSTPPARELESRVKRARFRHDGNAALRWHAANTVVTRKVDGSLVPKKDHAESPNKIDGIEAILRSLSGWLKADPKKGGGGQYQAMVFG
jgi:phage terminase large subunit-like protein